jgi:Ras-related protein Rab-8A
MGGSARQVQTAQGEQLAREYGIKFFETSARNNTNVREAFTTLATDVVERLLASGSDEQASTNVDLARGGGGGNKGEKRKGGGGCC